MQKIVQSLGEHLKPVWLYLDDVEQIVEIFRQVSSDVSISTKEFALSDLKQLTELKKEFITDLHIQIREPYVSLSLESNRIWLYAQKDEAVSRGLFEQVKQVLSKNKRSFDQLLQNSALLGLFMGSSFPLLAIGIRESTSWLIFLSVIMIMVSILWGWYGYQDRFKRYSIVIPKYRIETPSFWKRNSDAFLLSIFSAIIGGIITLILVKVFGVSP